METLFARLKLLEILYISLADFVVWDENFDSIPFFSHILPIANIILWIRESIDALELDLITFLGRAELSQYFNLCRGLFLDRYIEMSLFVNQIALDN